MVKGGLGPVDPAREAFLESHVGPGCLEVEELLGVDVREAARLPGLRKETGGQGGSLRSVVPTPEGGDEHRAAQGGAALYAEMSADGGSLGEPRPRSEDQPGCERNDTRP